MRMHLLTHLNGSYTCPKCDKLFIRRDDFDHHIKSHIKSAEQKLSRAKRKEEKRKRVEKERKKGVTAKMYPGGAVESNRRRH